jgi:hypothetical protein
MQNDFKNIKTITHKPIGELMPERVEVLVGKETVVMIYKPIACHGYNKININNKEINVATIDTILSFYLVMIYIDVDLNYNRLLCMANFLYNIQIQNRLNQRGLLKRFSMDCYGKQLTLEDIRAEKARKYKEFKENGVDKKEYEMWFLKYTPSDKLAANKNNKTRKVKRAAITDKDENDKEEEPKKRTVMDILRAAVKTH